MPGSLIHKLYQISAGVFQNQIKQKNITSLAAWKWEEEVKGSFYGYWNVMWKYDC